MANTKRVIIKTSAEEQIMNVTMEQYERLMEESTVERRQGCSYPILS